MTDDLVLAEKIISDRRTEIDVFISGTAIAEIKDQSQYDSAIEIGKAVKTKYQETEAKRRELVDPLNEVVKKINAGFKKILEPLEAFERGIKRVCVDYQGEQERIRQEAQRKAQEAARIERERIEAQARVQREKEDAARHAEEEARSKAAEKAAAAKRAEELALKMIQDAKTAEERKRLEAEAAERRIKEEAEAKALAIEAEKNRKAAEAAAAKAETKEAVAATVVAPIIESKVETRGVSGVQKWRTTVTDKGAFLGWVIEKNALEYILIDIKLLDKESCGTKGVRQWPGIAVEKYIEARMRK